MSVLCCQVPDFLVGLARRNQPDLSERPLALLGADERVWAVSREAQLSGVSTQMTPRQAQMRCPDVFLRPLDTEGGEAEQSAFVRILAECGLPVEAQTWGIAYVDLHAVAKTTAQSVQPICAEMGKQMRHLLGESLVPALGWDTGKFTARVASDYARPGHMRLVEHSAEERFLSPLPITLLPLETRALQQLDWLGITTLGLFAQLPATAVWQRFGQSGKLAQRFAQGRDNRPVCPNAKTTPQAMTVDFDPPTALHAPVLEAALALLRPQLSLLADQLEGYRHLRLDLGFAEGSWRTLDCLFVEPVGEERRLRATLSHQFQILEWPAELSTLNITLLERGELVTRQLTLFEIEQNRPPLLQLAQKLSGRYGNVFFRAQLTDERHPLPERRSVFNLLTAGSSI